MAGRVDAKTEVKYEAAYRVLEDADVELLPMPKERPRRNSGYQSGESSIVSMEGVGAGSLHIPSGLMQQFAATQQAGEESLTEILYFEDGSRYHGPTQNGIPDGEDGVMTWPNGEVYSGDFKDGVPDGDGIRQGVGFEEEGEFQHGVIWNGTHSNKFVTVQIIGGEVAENECNCCPIM
ncbi:MAG: hypothetical protein HYX48_01820 [Chlamydiales bacterium]|nr:hypothetical protein [Chlamydiales bacterium]